MGNFLPAQNPASPEQGLGRLISSMFQVASYDRKTNALPVRDVGGYTNSIYVTR